MEEGLYLGWGKGPLKTEEVLEEVANEGDEDWGFDCSVSLKKKTVIL